MYPDRRRRQSHDSLEQSSCETDKACRNESPGIALVMSVIAVTGASAGLGRAIAVEFANAETLWHW
jgi:hypothetical protein